MKDRGMVKWAPYKSLDRQEDYLRKLLYDRSKVEKPLLSEERAMAIDRILSGYHGQTVTVRYFEEGFIKELSGTISVIDGLKRILFIDETEIGFWNLLDISEEEDPFMDEKSDSFGEIF